MVKLLRQGGRLWQWMVEAVLKRNNNGFFFFPFFIIEFVYCGIWLNIKSDIECTQKIGSVNALFLF